MYAYQLKDEEDHILSALSNFHQHNHGFAWKALVKMGLEVMVLRVMMRMRVKVRPNSYHVHFFSQPRRRIGTVPTCYHPSKKRGCVGARHLQLERRTLERFGQL